MSKRKPVTAAAHELLGRLDRLMGTCVCCSAKSGAQHDAECVVRQLVELHASADADLLAKNKWLESETERARAEAAAMRRRADEESTRYAKARTALEDFMHLQERFDEMIEFMQSLSEDLTEARANAASAALQRYAGEAGPGRPLIRGTLPQSPGEGDDTMQGSRVVAGTGQR